MTEEEAQERIKGLEATLALVINTARPVASDKSLRFSNRASLLQLVLDAASKYLEEKK